MFLTHFQKQPLADVLQNSVLKNSAIFTGKQLCWTLFLMKLQAFRPATVLPVNITKFLRTPF